MKQKDRIWELDFVRGIAVILMVIFHLIFDLNYFYGFERLKYDQGLWYFVGRTSAIIFITLVGITSAVIYKYDGRKVYPSKTLKRSMIVLFSAMIITGATFLIYRSETIYFGILHFMGISMLLVALFLRFIYLNLFFSIGIFFISYIFKSTDLNHILLIPFGFPPSNFISFDYYPLFPWFGLILLGIFFGNLLYSHSKSLFPKPESTIMHIIMKIGRYSLIIYLLHQPILLLILKLIFF